MLINKSFTPLLNYFFLYDLERKVVITLENTSAFSYSALKFFLELLSACRRLGMLSDEYLLPFTIKRSPTIVALFPSSCIAFFSAGINTFFLTSLMLLGRSSLRFILESFNVDFRLQTESRSERQVNLAIIGRGFVEFRRFFPRRWTPQNIMVLDFSCGMLRSHYALCTVTINRRTRNSCIERNYLHFIRGDYKPLQS